MGRRGREASAQASGSRRARVRWCRRPCRVPHPWTQTRHARSPWSSRPDRGSPAPGVASTGEADQYAAVRKIMTSIGCDVKDAEPVVFDGIKIVPGPEIVLKPSFVVCPAEYKKQFPNPKKIKISPRSSLVVKGNGVTIESLDLDGALVIECEEGASGVIRDLVVKNEGWKKVANVSDASPEFIRIRGYYLKKVETKIITVRKDGTIDDHSPKLVVDSTQQAENNTQDLSRPSPREAGSKDGQSCCVIS